VGSPDVDARYAARLAEEVQGLPVTLCGQLPPESVRRIVQSADLLLMPSYLENHPLVLLEAVAGSVPVVAYAAGAVGAVLTDGQEGFITAMGDVVALARRIELLIADEQLRYGFAQACWRRQGSLRTWRAAADHARDALELAVRP